MVGFAFPGDRAMFWTRMASVQNTVYPLVTAANLGGDCTAE